MSNLLLMERNTTIKSTELVDIINQFRAEEGKTELKHSDFMKKVRKEVEVLESLGLGGQGNFSLANYLDAQGKERDCFELTRDGMLQMLNSESTLVRYKTIEYINKLEQENKALLEDNKELDKIAVSDKEQKERLLEANKITFSERRTQKSFANCKTYSEYKELYNRFLNYIPSLKADDRVIKMKLATKGMETLRVNLLLENFDNVGNAINVDSDIKYLLKNIDKLNNRMLGGEKAGKTKTIAKLKEEIDSLVIPDNYYVTLVVHGFSNNYMYKYVDGATYKTEAYKNWINNFPVNQIPYLDFWSDIDFTKPVEIFIKYMAKPEMDIRNFDKSFIDVLFHELGVDDNIIDLVHSERAGVVEHFNEGKILFYMRNKEQMV